MPIWVALLGLLAAPAIAADAAAPEAGERQRLHQAFVQEMAFREAAIHVAWAAEPLCDDTSEIEPFVLWSTRALRQRLPAALQAVFTQATGMDEHWRVAWLDEGAPDELRLGQRVLAVNGRPLPEPGHKFEWTALLRGGSAWSVDDQAFWTVMHQARDEAAGQQRITLTLEDGRQLPVDTQTGCAGTVVASRFDDEPGHFAREPGRRSKLPGNALLAALQRDDYRWLAAFGTYFLASESALLRQRTADTAGQAYLVGKVLTLAVPGAGTVFTALEAHTQRALQVTSLVGAAELFANEVVMAMGGDPGAGLRLLDRLQAAGSAVDVLQPDAFRRSNIGLQLERLRALQAEQERLDRAEQARYEQAVAAPSPVAGPAPGGSAR